MPELRVDAVFAQAKSMAADADLGARILADQARQAAAKGSLWIFVALLLGAFCASLAATLGGRQRDRGAHVSREEHGRLTSRDAEASFTH